MTARLLAPLRRLAAMDRAELRFRAAGELRTRRDQLRWRVTRPRWARRDLARMLAHAPGEGHLDAARRALRAGRWAEAHHALARQVLGRPARFPLSPTSIPSLATRVRERFQAAASESAARADRVLAGQYDILGYRGIRFGAPPRWHYDPVHDREAPGGFWSQVPYLDPAHGDHKVIWEVNRHQHWLALARAFHLTGDRRYYAEAIRQLTAWMPANPPLGGVNWASMLELGFRALSWTWTLHFFAGTAVDDPPDGPPWLVDLLLGLDRQLSHVAHNLSRYFSPNTHLTGEALALYVCGTALPELAASGRRAALGRDVLLAEATRQVRPDGGHAEQSAHYHRYSTDFYLLALMTARAGDDTAAPAFERAARAQALYLRTIADDRGRLPLIGDDDGGQLFPICGRPPSDCRDTLAVAALVLGMPELAVVGEPPEEAWWLAGGSGAVEGPRAPAAAWPSASFDDTGYCVSRTAAGDHLVLDAGPHGFLNGGHAHADALSIVLTVAGRPLLVDPGTATYTMDMATRDLFRSTAMHNTLTVNGRAQSEPRGPFHWRGSAGARRSLWRTGAGVDYIEARHEAYAPFVHARAVLALHGVGWCIVDHILGEHDASAESYWHVHPDWTVVSLQDGVAMLQHADGAFHPFASSTPLADVAACGIPALGAWAPEYGRIEPAPCLTGRSHGRVPRSVLTFVPAGSHCHPSVRVEAVPITNPPPAGWHAAAFRVEHGGVRLIVGAAVELDGVPREDAAAPAAPWGGRDFAATARVSATIERADSNEVVLVNGRAYECAAGRIVLDALAPIERRPFEGPSAPPSWPHPCKNGPAGYEF